MNDFDTKNNVTNTEVFTVQEFKELLKEFDNFDQQTIYIHCFRAYDSDNLYEYRMLADTFSLFNLFPDTADKDNEAYKKIEEKFGDTEARNLHETIMNYGIKIGYLLCGIDCNAFKVIGEHSLDETEDDIF